MTGIRPLRTSLTRNAGCSRDLRAEQREKDADLVESGDELIGRRSLERTAAAIRAGEQ